MYKCNICARTRGLVKAGDLVLCGTCIEAIYRALKPKIRAQKRKTARKTTKKRAQR